MRTPIPTEHQEQCQLFEWAEWAEKRFPGLHLMHAIPNGGKRDIRTAAMLKAEGVKPGVPDIFLPVPRGGKHGLYIELKRRKGGTVSKEQEAWIRALIHQGYACAVCHGWEAARDVIIDYMRSEDNDKTRIYPAAFGQSDAETGAGACR